MKTFVLLLHAFIAWTLCGAIIGIGRQLTTIDNILIIHAIGAPIIFAIISYIYFKKYSYSQPFQTALFFTALVVFMDFFIVALLIEKNFSMFSSILGTWLPFLLIFLTTYAVGSLLNKK